MGPESKGLEMGAASETRAEILGAEREKSEAEKVAETYSIKGFSEYYGVKAAEAGDTATLQKFAKSEAALIRHEMENMRAEGEYAGKPPQELRDMAMRFKNLAAGGVDEYAMDTLLKGTADQYRFYGGGGVKEYVEQEKADLESDKKKSPKDRPRMYKEKALSKLSGFGRAALENGDLEVAIDALAAAGSLRSPEIAKMLKGKIATLKKANDLESRQLYQKASQKLLEVEK